MKTNFKRLLVLLLIMTMSFSLVACGSEKVEPEKETSKSEEVKDVSEDVEDILDKDWETILEEAKGTTVNFYGYGGNQQYNEWVDGFLSDMAKEKYDIKINRVGMDIDEILNLMLNEKQANKEDGSVDLVWINGENFFTAKENELLFGPFTDKIPNFEKYVDGDSDDIKFDFGHLVEGYEAPYGKAQFVMVYDEENIEEVPKGHEELLEWAKNNPGRFTYPALPDFTGSVFVRNIISDIVGYEQFMDIEKDEEVIREAMQPALDYLLELKPYLWKEGKTYPAESQLLDNMFADGEVDMTMTYNPNGASSMIENGIYKESTRTFVFDKGTVGNTHFVAIGHNSPNKAGAMALVDLILSPEVQASKYAPVNWGDLPVIDNDKLSNEEKELFDKVDIGEATLPQDLLLEHRIPEMPADIVPIIEKIWMETIPGEGN